MSLQTLASGIKQCEDFMLFQSALKQMRQIDDKIVYAINNAVPTRSFKGQIDPSEKCQELYREVENIYRYREEALNTCINYSQEKISKAAQDNDRAGQRQAQMQLRVLTNELSIEEVIRNRTNKILHEKCRDHLL
jgi:hypothetical protein